MAKKTLKGFGALGKMFGLEPEKKSPPPPPKKNAPVKKFPPPPSRATAPYNFVSLPAEVLPAQFELENFREHVLKDGKLSGEILLDIEALTPLFIGGNGTKTFAPVGKPIIPGSSLRGMFKNILKVVTCGAFRGRTTSQKKGEDFNDEHIYFRCLMTTKSSPAWMGDLNKLYKNRMVSEKKGADGKLHPVKNARPGFLICTADNKFFIAPSLQSNEDKDRIFITEYEEIFHTTIGIRDSSCVEWRDDTAYIITGSQPAHKLHTKESYEKFNDFEKKKAGKQQIRFTRIGYVDWCRDHWIELPDDVRTSYEHDRNRRGVNLFKGKGILKRAKIEQLTGKSLPDVQSLIPCHYLQENGQITAFGHGQYFRIPYKKRIGDAVPKTLQGENVVDFSDALLGKEKHWASRVYFEDAAPKNFSELPQATAHPLMQPNPTSYQIYLTQDGKDGKLKHWDADAQIRGYKFYWHNANPDWHASDAELEEDEKRSKNKQEPLTREMTPLGKGSKFAAKIRFQNLSAVELGALMMIFDLDGAENPAYKIGQGKPFGFGSVKISPTLFIEDAAAYTELFGAEGWQSPYREENPAKYLAAFKDYLECCGMQTTWQDVMDELKKILDWKTTELPNWSAKIKSMSGDVAHKGSVDERFKTREILPTIFEVVK